MKTVKYTVIKEYDDGPAHPIIIEKGERLEFVKESDPEGDWSGWIYCKGKDKEGWVPRQILLRNGSELISSEHYSALEHVLRKGEILYAEKELNGWIWCRKEYEEDEYRWAPLNHLKQC